MKEPTSYRSHPVPRENCLSESHSKILRRRQGKRIMPLVKYKLQVKVVDSLGKPEVYASLFRVLSKLRNYKKSSYPASIKLTFKVHILATRFNIDNLFSSRFSSLLLENYTTGHDGQWRQHNNNWMRPAACWDKDVAHLIVIYTSSTMRNQPGTPASKTVRHA